MYAIACMSNMNTRRRAVLFFIQVDYEENLFNLGINSIYSCKLFDYILRTFLAKQLWTAGSNFQIKFDWCNLWAQNIYWLIRYKQTHTCVMFTSIREVEKSLFLFFLEHSNNFLRLLNYWTTCFCKSPLINWPPWQNLDKKKLNLITFVITLCPSHEQKFLAVVRSKIEK